MIKPKPRRIESFDALFGMEDQASIQKDNNGTRVYCTLKLEQLHPFKDHPFKLYMGERLSDMVDSIKANGVLVPIIVRTLENGDYEILSGHNRVNAARLADLDEIAAIVKENLPDDEAMVYVVETNLIQRSFADMLPSEKGYILQLYGPGMFNQGKRNDIILELKMLEKPHNGEENSTSAHSGRKLETREIIGSEYDLSKNSVSRLLRIAKLIEPLKTRVDKNEIPLLAGVTLSYLSNDEQHLLEDILEEHVFKLDVNKSKCLRTYSEKKQLSEDKIYKILKGEMADKPKKADHPPVKIKYKVYSKYFSEESKASDIEKIVDEALELYFANKSKERVEC